MKRQLQRVEGNGARRVLHAPFIVMPPRLAYEGPVTATAALQKQIERYRQMTGEERLSIALGLHEMSCDIARESIRREKPQATPAEVERLLRRRLALASVG